MSERAKAGMHDELEAMLAFQEAGAEVFDYGNNIRAGAEDAGLARAFDIKGFVPLYVRPLFLRRKGPFRWVALSGDPADIAATDEAVLAAVPHDEDLRRWSRSRQERVQFQGLPVAHLLARIRRARQGRPSVQRAGSQRKGKGAHRHRARSPRLRLGGFTQPRDRRHERRLGRDRRLGHPERAGSIRRRARAGFSFHHGGGVGIGNSLHAGMGRRRRRDPRSGSAGSSVCSRAIRAWA